MWAYLTIQETLRNVTLIDPKDPKYQKALDLALKFNFVTPITSLVVTNPNITEASEVNQT